MEFNIINWHFQSFETESAVFLFFSRNTTYFLKFTENRVYIFKMESPKLCEEI